MYERAKFTFAHNESELANLMKKRGISKDHLIEFYGVDQFKDRMAKYTLITMELGLATVDDRLKALPTFPWKKGEKKFFIRSVVQGVLACHECDIRHRDVRPANVLIMPHGGIKLTDFGFSRVKQEQTQQSVMETMDTPTTLQPREVYLAVDNDLPVKVHKPIDIFMAGATIATIARDNKLPFHDSKETEIRKLITEGRQPQNVMDDLKSEPLLLHLILWSLDHDYTKRPSSMRVPSLSPSQLAHWHLLIRVLCAGHSWAPILLDFRGG